jgi:hypothetical protein
MSFWKSLFGGGRNEPVSKAGTSPDKSLEYKGYLIEATPFQEAGQFQLSGVISKTVDGERREHKFIRADKFTTKEDASEVALSKGQLIIDQSGDAIFK